MDSPWRTGAFEPNRLLTLAINPGAWCEPRATPTAAQIHYPPQSACGLGLGVHPYRTRAAAVALSVSFTIGHPRIYTALRS